MTFLTVMATIDLFGKELPVVLRERHRNQYTVLEYLLTKSLAEIPLDFAFATLFTTTLKACSGLRIKWEELTAAFCLMTFAGKRVGYLVVFFLLVYSN
eukprot:CAMPEP_0178736536 /NCGR_PEP_ID=MMETSP0744-20121128/2491_1 /TAXON_ID=913974 /ORGANISM="Nitzschia punctata, Strain CCMP561" /LENGTH=97 /DNA_ID=CAMNT_0020389013 /DNA_START=257 /DNA_END=547 /DNA_ORIENTATION=+